MGFSFGGVEELQLVTFTGCRRQTRGVQWNDSYKTLNPKPWEKKTIATQESDPEEHETANCSRGFHAQGLGTRRSTMRVFLLRFIGH